MGPSLLFIGGREYTCKPCFVKLEKGCKTIHAIQRWVQLPKMDDYWRLTIIHFWKIWLIASKSPKNGCLLI